MLIAHQQEIRTLIAHLRTEQQEMRAEVHAMMGRPDPRNSGPWTPGFPSPSVCICRPTHRPNDLICQWSPTIEDDVAAIAERFRETATDEEKIALARALRESVCVCSPTHRPDDPICQWKE